MDITSLETLVAVIEEKSFSRGADRVHLVASAVSKRIACLERESGVTLVQRNRRGVEPTPAGIVLYQQAKSIVLNLRRTKETLATFSSNGLPKIRLAANSSAILQFLSQDISSFSSVAPHTRIDLIEAFSFDIPRLVASGESDIGICHSSRPPPGVTSKLYRSDTLVLVVPHGHPLEVKRQLKLEAALDFDFLGYFPRRSIEAFMELAGTTLSRPPEVKIQVSNYEARCQLVSQGLGIAIIPSTIAQRYASHLGLSLLPLIDDWASRQLYTCVPEHITLSPDVRQLFDHLTANNP